MQNPQCLLCHFVDWNLLFIFTRSCAALRAADLDWIIGPGYSLSRYILEKNHEKPTWHHEKPWKTMKNREEPTWNHEKPWKSMKTHEKHLLADSIDFILGRHEDGKDYIRNYGGKV